MAAGSKPVDVRSDRAVQGTITVVVLAAFVFRQQWAIPVMAVLLGAGALFGPAGNAFHRIFAALVAPRLPAAEHTEPASTIRAQDMLAAAILGVATLCMLIGLGGLAWIVGLIEAGVAAVAATTGVHLGETARDRFRKQ